MLTNFLLALGLAMDSFAVALSKGLVVKQERLKKSLKIAIFFAVFQGGLTTLGWLVGSIGLNQIIERFDHWIAFVLLSFIGGKMVMNFFRSDLIGVPPADSDSLTWRFLILMSIATSIDAVAAGLSLAFLNISILQPALIIVFVTFILSYFGVWFGNRLGKVLQQRVELLGGLILIGIGIKILIQHLS